MMRRLAVLATLLLSGCQLTTMFEPKLAPITEDPLAIDVSDIWSVPTDAKMPTDVAVLATGGFGVLDGYKHRTLVFGQDHAFVGAVQLPKNQGTAVRASRSADGQTWWFTVPDADGILRVNPQGQVVQTVVLTHPDGSIAEDITAVHDTAIALVVGLADGRIAWADRTTGRIMRTLDQDVDGAPFGMIVDIHDAGDGNLLVVDTFGAKVHVINPLDGEPVSWVGKFGMWSGYLAKPKSAAPGPDGTYVVADSELGVVQVYDRDGTPLGVLRSEGELLHFEHPIAVDAISTNEFVALDQLTATVWGFSITDAELAAARASADDFRHLRTKLIAGTYDERLSDGTLCFQCHDGTILDDRAVWDHDRYHHPVGVVPDVEVPSFFPLQDGKIVCTTCHSPHGTVEVSDVVKVEGGTELRTDLVRHVPESESDLFTRLSRSDSKLCVACHSEAAHDRVLEQVGLTGTSHPTGKALADALAKRGTEAVAGLPPGVDDTCLSCHAVHGAERKALNRDAESGHVCLSCHQDRGKPADNHPLNKRPAADLRVQLAALPLSDEGTQTCRTCHEMVGGRTRALLRVPESGTLCTTCHDPNKIKGPHGKVEGKAGQTCLGCHSPHGAPIEHHLLATLKAATDKDPDGCLGCHGPGGKEFVRGVRPGELGHPVGLEEVENCEVCHDPHQPQEQPPCVQCHDEQQKAFDRGGHGAAECKDCHPPHSAPPTLSRALEPKGQEPLNPTSRRCLACHARGTDWDATKVGVYEHPTPVFAPDGTRWTPLGKLPLYDDQGNLMPPGKNGDLTCWSCHLVHGPDPVTAGDNLRRPDWQEACSACHGDEALVLYRYFHDPRARSQE